MEPRPTRRSPVLAARGASWVTLLLLLSLAAGAYLAWVWVPLWVVHYEVKQVLADHMNQAVKDKDDAALVQRMCKKLHSLAQVEVPGDDGVPVRVPAVEVAPTDVAWERSEESGRPVLHVAFAYTRVVVYPWIGWTDEKTFEVEGENDLTKPDWGPMR
jgi:hypothetical protein